MHVIANLKSGGVQKLLVDSLAAFDRSHFYHCVCCITQGGVYERSLTEIGIPYWIMKRHFRIDPSILLQMARLMRHQQIDVVHCLNFTASPVPGTTCADSAAFS